MPQDTMLVHGLTPYNAEPCLPHLVKAFQTPEALFYSRNHGITPDAGPGYRLHVGGLVRVPLDLSIAALQSRFAHHTVVATLQCAGNRRADLQPVKPTLGDPWAAGAIGTAEWTGARLADVLDAAGLDPDASNIAFESLDLVADHGDTPYAVSIPLAKAMAPEVLLAWAMNGHPLACKHGAPLRAVVPGYAGVRSAKWIAAVTVRSSPADSPVQHQDYKLLPADVTAETVDWERGAVINAMPVNSAICVPTSGAVTAGAILVRGWAMASARMVARVDVSSDGGLTWQQATLEQGTQWAWTLWQITLDLDSGDHELIVRAWDDAGQTQPAEAAACWNFKGYLATAWHRVPVTAR